MGYSGKFNFLKRNATWSSILGLLGLIILFNLLIFPFVYGSKNDKATLDTQFSYSSEKAYKILEKYSDEELKGYIIGELTVDLVFPIVYTLFFSFFIFKLSKKVALSLLPLLILVSDYLENIGIVAIVYFYPQTLPNIVTLTSSFTSLKWTLVAIFTLLILLLLVMKLYKHRKNEF
jgi:hypothetical protein